MEKLYKLIFLFVGLVAMNLTVQAQLNSYNPLYSISLISTNLNFSSKININNAYITGNWNDELRNWQTSQVTGFTNYPNPATTYTTIGYTLPVKSNVLLKVIDLAGKQLAILIKQEQAAGKKEYYWELAKNNINAGMYILILQVDNKTYSRKIIVQ